MIKMPKGLCSSFAVLKTLNNFLKHWNFNGFVNYDLAHQVEILFLPLLSICLIQGQWEYQDFDYIVQLEFHE